MSKKIKYYKSINKIPVYIFYKIIDEKDVKFLIKNYYKDKEIKITENLQLTLQQVFDKIVQEYNILTATKKNVKSIKAQANIDYMECIYDTVSFCLQCYSNTKQISFLNTINKIDDGFSFSENNSIEQEVKKILSKLKGLKMKIKLAKIKFADMYNIKVEEDKQTNYTQELDSIALNIEMSLELKYTIDTMKTNLLRWVTLINKVKEKQENYG